MQGMKEEILLPIEDFVKKAKKLGVNFGKSDPYNRLRYYTKMSLLPHMERRLSKDEGLKAFYPASALEKLVKIESLKAKGFSNVEVLEKLKKEERSLLKVVKSHLTTQNIFLFGILVLVFLIFLNNKGILNLSKEGGDSFQVSGSLDPQILESGVSMIKAGRKSTIVPSSKITELSDIQIAFKDSFSPATTYYISEKVPGEGFVLSLDAQSASDVNFAWWIVQK